MTTKPKRTRGPLLSLRSASELAAMLVQEDEECSGTLGNDILMLSYNAYCVPLYQIHKMRSTIWPSVASTLGLFSTNRLLQKYHDHGDFESLARVWMSARSIIVSVLDEFEQKGGCVSCASTYFWGCRQLGDKIYLKCATCAPEQHYKKDHAHIDVSKITKAERERVGSVNKALELCELKHRCCQECLARSH